MPKGVYSGQHCGEFGGTRRSDGAPCQWPAGYRTDHKGDGKCATCSRFGGGRPIIHGRYSKKGTIAQRAKEIAESGVGLSVSGALAQMQATHEAFRDMLDARGEDLTVHEAELLSDMMLKQIKGLKTLEDIRTSNALTPAEVNAIQNRIAECIIEFLPDPETRARFMAKLRGEPLPAPARPALPEPEPAIEGEIVERTA